MLIALVGLMSHHSISCVYMCKRHVCVFVLQVDGFRPFPLLK